MGNLALWDCKDDSCLYLVSCVTPPLMLGEPAASNEIVFLLRFHELKLGCLTVVTNGLAHKYDLTYQYAGYGDYVSKAVQKLAAIEVEPTFPA